MNDNILVTVIMPVFNAEKYLSLAIESVLNQTYKYFTLLIINDGSSDRSEDIILSYADPRICYVKNEKNIGIVKTLNKGLKLAETKYVARMDADDICEAERLEKQIAFLEANGQLSLLGTQAALIDESGKQMGILSPPENDRMIKTALLFSNVFIHSSVMIRSSILKKENWEYEYSHKAVEDYGLWLKIASKYSVGILPQKLLRYRINSEGIMANANKNQDDLIKNRSVIYKELFERLGICISDKSISDYTAFLNNCQMQIDLDNVGEICNKLRKEVNCNLQYDIKYFDILLSGICRGFAVANELTVKRYWKFLYKSQIWKLSQDILEMIKYIMTMIKQKKGKDNDGF